MAPREVTIAIYCTVQKSTPRIKIDTVHEANGVRYVILLLYFVPRCESEQLALYTWYMCFKGTKGFCSFGLFFTGLYNTTK